MAEKKYWYQKQLRILQTVLREPDIINYDAVAVVKYMKKNLHKLYCSKCRWYC